MRKKYVAENKDICYPDPCRTCLRSLAWCTVIVIKRVSIIKFNQRPHTVLWALPTLFYLISSSILQDKYPFMTILELNKQTQRG